MTLSTALIDTVNSEIRKMAEFLIENPDGTQYTDPDKAMWNRWYEGKLESGEVSFNMRLDWELADLDDLNDKFITNLMVQQISVDLLDLLENGDVEGPINDALLRGTDGVKKRGKEPVDFKIASGLLYKEYKKNKKSYEYTVFIRPFINWG